MTRFGKRKSSGGGGEEEGGREAKVSRFRRHSKPISQEELDRRKAIEDDERPATFADGTTHDRWDKQAAPVPITKKNYQAALDHGIQLFHQRRAVRRDVFVEEAVPAADPTKAVYGAEGTDLDDELDAFSRELEKLTLDADARLTIRSRETLCSDLLRDIARSGGDLRLEAIRKTLGSLGYHRSKQQKIFHNAFIKACLPIIYGKWMGVLW